MISKRTAAHWINLGVIVVLGLVVAVDLSLVIIAKNIGKHGQVQNTEIQDADIVYRHGANDSSSVDLTGADPLNQFAQKLVHIRPPVGYTAKGVQAGIAPKQRAGWVVRYVSTECGFCGQDNIIWNRLASELQHSGYQIITVTPSAREAYSDDKVVPKGAPQEAYVSMEWIRQFQLTVTPTLLIFSPDERLIWARQGMLQPNDATSALLSVKTADISSIDSVSKMEPIAMSARP